MRQRVEDLGRLMVMIDQILIHSLFEDRPNVRNKDFEEWFYELKKEEQEATLHAMIYGISDIHEKLYECLEVAKGEDYLNERDKDIRNVCF